MRVLAVTYANRIPDNKRLYESLARLVDLEHVEMTRAQALDLKSIFRNFDLLDFDRVVLEVRAKHAIRQWRTLWKVPNLVLFEEDTWQNYAAFSKNYGFFAKFYARVQPARIVHSGFEVAQKTAALGFDSRFLPKGFDGGKLKNLEGTRDIEMAFIGRTSHGNYVNRKRLLDELARVEPLRVLRTHSDQEYLQTLNRIRFFISADIGFGEHMIKNFEAMACGCVLFAYPQGEDDRVLGLKDMENVVFYNSVAQLQHKLATLRHAPELADRIAQRGQRLAEDNHDHWVLGEKFHDILAAPLRHSSAAQLRLYGMRAEKEMSERVAGQLAPLDLPCGPQAWYEYRGLWFRFFTEGSKWTRLRARRAFVEGAAALDALGLSGPVPLFWGRRHASAPWVACRMPPGITRETVASLSSTANTEAAAATLARLRGAGYDLSDRRKSAILWGADGCALVLDPGCIEPTRTTAGR